MVPIRDSFGCGAFPKSFPKPHFPTPQPRWPLAEPVQVLELPLALLLLAFGLARTPSSSASEQEDGVLLRDLLGAETCPAHCMREGAEGGAGGAGTPPPSSLHKGGERAQLFGVPPKRGRPPPGHPASPRRELGYGFFFGGGVLQS